MRHHCCGAKTFKEPTSAGCSHTADSSLHLSCDWEEDGFSSKTITLLITCEEFPQVSPLDVYRQWRRRRRENNINTRHGETEEAPDRSRSHV